MSVPSVRAALRVAALYVVCIVPAFAADNAAAPTRLPGVDVIGTTPLPGVGLAREQIAAPVQSATSADLERSNTLELTDFMNRNLGSVHINEIQGNASQPDVNYRGYTASPLLGTPQGLSVYMDGVRLNQPFGDVVSWDLIPKSAIASINLMPGSNPLFGLNTLGGALSIQTKDGRSHAGTSLQSILGSDRRRSAELTHGGAAGSLDWFVTANLHRDEGWRDDSPSRLGQFFGKLGWRGDRSDLKLTYAFADNTLKGNGLQEQKFLVRDYASVYTRPDITDNHAHFLNLAASHDVSERLLLTGNTYYRKIKTDTFNADINEGALNQNVYAAGENATNTPFPFARCVATVILAATDPTQEPGERCNALINRTNTQQEAWGLAAQATWQGLLAGHRNQLTAGGGIDESRVSFSQSSQLGYLNPDRTVNGLNAYADGGLTGGELDGVPFDNRVSLDGKIRTWSGYATNTTSFRERWHLTLSGRFNRTNIRNQDHINPGGGASSLDGDHTFSRFNPAFGLTFAPSKALMMYAGYNEGSRAPTSIELGCANPAQPCRLPNAMAGDPPLNQVVAKTWEAGLQGAITENLQWQAGLFRAENVDDILFVAAPNQAFGYFRNFGKTRREGVELGLRGSADRFSFGGNYSLIRATFQSAESVNATNNSSNDAVLRGDAENGNVQISPGDNIPLVPRHILKLFADYRVNAGLVVNFNMLAVGSSFARGNENNLHEPDGRLFLGPGRAGGYAIFNLGAQYQIEPALKLTGSIQNLFNRQYSTAAQLGASGFNANGNFVARPFAPPAANNDVVRHATFFAPGAPRSFWIGLRYTFDATKQIRQTVN
jgi:outer membrane receptor protein involved in Fe transport